MKQVVQPLGGGPVSVLDVPRPTIGPTQVLVRTVASIISPGTERAVTSLAQASLLSKARARPDLVRQVVKKARSDGIASTLRTVQSRLASDLPLGYSAAGIAMEVGEAVDGVRPGQLVATGGAGQANHAEWQAVAGLLCVAVPDGVRAEDAAFTTLASIALHGLRLAEVGPGSKVVVLGLGLVGQLACRLAQASGCEVAGIDLAPEPLKVAQDTGVLALLEEGEETTRRVLEWSRGRGADAVLLCATGSSSTPVQRTPALCRDKATVVVVGDVGLQLTRTPLYEKELVLRFARSYGPGRYELAYEEYGIDYPAGQVRWTAGRNFEAVLDLMAVERLRVRDLVTHRFGIAEAAQAYDLIETRREPHLAIALDYPQTQPIVEPPLAVSPPSASADLRIGWIGAGAYSTGTLLPAFRSAGFDHFVSVVSGSGLTARRAAERHGFQFAVSTAEQIIDDADIDVVVIATPHDKHASLAAKALRAGKHVWCEKPLALGLDELDEVDAAWRASGRVLWVGYNRRWAPYVVAVRDELPAAPAVINYRVSAGPVPARHWYADRRQGGRLLGEVCHFVDTCAALTGSDVLAVNALAGRDGELLLADDAVVILSHRNGSLSTISYASGGHSDTSKERIEVASNGHTWVIDDFRRLERDGKLQTRRDGQDKGQCRAVSAFHTLLQRQNGQSDPSAELIASTRATLSADMSALKMPL